MIRPDDLSAFAAKHADELAERRARFQREDRLAIRILFGLTAAACLAVGYGIGFL